MYAVLNYVYIRRDTFHKQRQAKDGTMKRRIESTEDTTESKQRRVRPTATDDKRLNTYTYNYNFKLNDVMYKQRDQLLYFPIPNREDTMNIERIGTSKHFPPMRDDFVLPVGYKREETYNVIDFLVDVLAVASNKQLIQDEVNASVAAIESFDSNGDIVYAKKQPRWWSHTLYGEFLIMLFCQGLIVSFIHPHAGVHWSRNKTSVSVIVGAVMECLYKDALVILNTDSMEDQAKLLMVDRLFVRVFMLVSTLIGVCVGEKSSTQTKEKCRHFDQTVRVDLTRYLRYSTPIKNKNINPMFTAYSALTCKLKPDVYPPSQNTKEMAESVYFMHVNNLIRMHIPEKVDMRIARMKLSMDHKQLLNREPHKVEEKCVKKIAHALVQIVFPSVYTSPWDGPYGRNCNDDELAAMLALLQLCIGSRSRGVTCMNLFSVHNATQTTAITSDRDVLKKMPHLIYVDQITKKKDTSLLAAYAVGNVFNVPKDQHTPKNAMVRPSHCHLLDPANWPHDIDAIRWSSSEDKTRDPRVVFGQLLRYARDQIYTRHSDWGDVQFFDSKFGYDITYKAITTVCAENNLHIVATVAARWQRRVTNVICDVLNDTTYLPPNLMVKVGTHELRRLYVCYGYWMFARDHMKELAFASAVLDHTSADVTLRYTGILIIPDDVPVDTTDGVMCV